MGATHGRLGILYKWNGTGSDLTDEACTGDGATAQITDTAKRILNPNSSNLAFSDSGGKNVVNIEYSRGLAYFDGDVTVVTCSGTAAYLAAGSLVKTGYLYEWGLNLNLAAQDLTDFQKAWKAFGGGLAEASGSAKGFMVNSNWFDDVEDNADGSRDYWFVELFSYDPDNDRTGDHYDCWVQFRGIGVNVPVGEYIKEDIQFEVHGFPNFVANS